MNDPQPPLRAPVPSRLRQFFSHLLHYGETYIVLPLFTLLVIGAIAAFHYVNQTDNIDDPIAALIHVLNAMLPLVLNVSFVGFIQTRVIGYRGHLKKENTMGDDLFDLVAFLSLFWSFAIVGRLL